MGHSYGFCWDHLTRYNSWKMILQVAPQRSCGMWIYLENHEILIEYPRNGWDPNSNHTFFWGGTKVLHWVIACNCKKLVFLRDFFSLVYLFEWYSILWTGRIANSPATAIGQLRPVLDKLTASGTIILIREGSTANHLST